MKNYYVYILANKRNGTLYTGVNNNLLRRIIEHKRKLNKGFTERYSVNKLVWYEQTNDIRIAIQREKRIKRWPRKWKLELIEKTNPGWKIYFMRLVGAMKCYILILKYKIILILRVIKSSNSWIPALACAILTR